MKDKIINWSLFIALSVIWGSSFLLMKIGLMNLSAYQVAAIRILSAGIVLLPFVFRSFREIQRNKIGIVILSGILGSFLPAFLFCIAETKLSSALTGMLNSLTPLFTIVLGVLFFKITAVWQKYVGIFIGLIGLYFLVAPNGFLAITNTSYILLVLLATLCYGINVNLVGRYMKGIGSINIAGMAFVFLIVPSTIILLYTGYFTSSIFTKNNLQSTVASAVLGVAGTAFASVLFYRLVKRAGALFASMVTYGIPFVAVAWGLVYGEQITLLQIGCLAVILGGVYLANKS